MKPELVDSYAPVSYRKIANFERLLHRTLPDDYRAFLLRTNGGVYHDEVCTPRFVFVEQFYGLDTGYDWSDLRMIREATRGWIPDTYLHIATSAGGDQISLSLDPESLGCVHHYYADSGLSDLLSPDSELSALFGNASPDEDITLIASSFTEFLESLSVAPNVEREVDIRESPAFQAIHLGATDRLSGLLCNGLDPNLQNDSKESLVARAAFKGRREILRVLLSSGGDPNIEDSKGANAGFYAVYADSLDCLQLLIANGLDINSRNHSGNTLLIEAIQRSAVRCAMKLLEVGADCTHRSKAGVSAISACINDDTKQYVLPVLRRAFLTVEGGIEGLEP
jgi:hypothetical protein